VAKIVLSNPGKVQLLQPKVGYLNTLKYYLYSSIQAGGSQSSGLLSDFVLVNDTANDGRLPVFSSAVMGTGNVAETNAPTIVWSFSYNAGVNQVIAGYCVVDPSSSQVIYSQAFAAPVTITGTGQQFSMAPKFQEDSLP
jgi:hypothetical protein